MQKGWERTLRSFILPMDSEKHNSSATLHQKMALFDCSELVLGKVIGKGAFCVVHELQAVRLNNSKRRPNFSRHWWDIKLHKEDHKREVIQQTCSFSGEECAGREVAVDDQVYSINNCTRYVVKHLKPNLAIERGYKIFVHATSDLRREYEILSRLSHPNIVQLRGRAFLEKGRDGGSLSINGAEMDDYFLLLERLQETLSQRILYWKRVGKSSLGNTMQDDQKCNALPPFYLEKLRFARDMASALSYVHDQRLVFRDLKPDNIGISFGGTVKLIDFGLSREIPNVSKDDCSRGQEPVFRMSGVGTRRYMAPELILGREYNHKIDCYSWALVFYEMLSLKKPYASFNRETHKLLVCDNQGRPSTSTDIPLSAQRILRRGWAHESWDRPSMGEIHNQMEVLIDSAERQAMTLRERSLRVVMEMGELFTMHNLTRSECTTKKDDSLTTAELTVSTAASGSSEASALSPPFTLSRSRS
jgi:serine/threonine protein kinase